MTRDQRELLPKYWKFKDSVLVPTISGFNPTEYFCKDVSNTTGVKISYLSPRFLSFLTQGVEEERPATVFDVCTTMGEYSEPKVEELLQSQKPSTFGQIFSLVEKQKDGRTGNLIVNGFSNAFGGRSEDGKFGLVYVRWFADGWCFQVGPYDGPGGYFAGHYVFIPKAV